jgi:hypothetical protein
MQIMQNPGFYNIFGGGPFEPKEKSPYEDLNDGFELRPIEMLAEGGQIVLDNREKYSHLYHNGVRIGNEIFRKGGMSNGFKDGYASLIHYTKREEHTEKKHGFDFGTHVIINRAGKIVLSGTGVSSYPSHYGKNVGKMFCDLEKDYLQWLLQWDGLSHWSAIRSLVQSLAS